MDTLEIKINDIHKICRICLEESKTMSSLYQNDNVYQMSVVELLKNCMSLKLEEDQDLPGLVCIRCEAEVFQMCEFRMRYEKSEKYLKEYLVNLESGNIKNQQIIIVKNDSYTEGNSLVVECPIEVLKDGNIEIIEDEYENDIGHKQHKTTKKRSNAGKEPYVCTKCNETFATKIQLTVHRRKFSHYTRKTVTCSKCKLVMPIQNYKSHYSKHLANFRCEFCAKTFSNNFNLKRHLYIHTNQTPYTCKICDAKFSRQDKLKVHVMVHTNEKPYTCDSCGQQFKNRDNLKQHKERVPGCCSEDAEYTDYKYKRTLSCDICLKSFALASSLRTHKLLHTDDRVICSECGKPYPNEKKLNIHKQKVHCKKEKKGKEFLCNICAKQYSNKAILQRHILSHRGLAKSYKCKICSKNFTQSGSLALHLKIHTGEKPFICHICSRAFNKPSNLQRHVKSHENVRPYVCTVCEKCFTVKQSLTVHMRIHTGEKPFACPVCNKKFIDRGSMTKHLKIHDEYTLIVS